MNHSGHAIDKMHIALLIDAGKLRASGTEAQPLDAPGNGMTCQDLPGKSVPQMQLQTGLGRGGDDLGVR